MRRERLRAALPRDPRPAPGPAPQPALVHFHTKTRCGSAPSYREPLRDSGRAAVQEYGGALRWAGASRLTPASRAQPGFEDRSPWRLPPAAGLRGRPAARRAQAVRTGGVAAQAPSPPRVAPAPSRRRLAGFAAGATAGRSQTPRQVSGAAARAGGPAREARGGSTGVSWPLSAGRVPGMPGGDEEETGAGGGLPSRPSSCRASASSSPAQTAVYNGMWTRLPRRWPEIFLSLRGPFWRILLCSAWARVQLRQMRVPVPGSSSPRFPG